MNCIVNVDKNWGIGLKNKLLVSIPADLRFFQSMTKGKVVIFGRSTLETFPAGKPLKNRVNIIITRNRSYSVPDALVAHSVEEALTFAKDYADEDVSMGVKSEMGLFWALSSIRYFLLSKGVRS